jgi:hypothetical protein
MARKEESGTPPEGSTDNAGNESAPDEQAAGRHQSQVINEEQATAAAEGDGMGGTASEKGAKHVIEPKDDPHGNAYARHPLPIFFLDMRQQEWQARQILRNRVADLRASCENDTTKLSQADQDELATDDKILADAAVIDAVFKTVQANFLANGRMQLPDHRQGLFPPDSSSLDGADKAMYRAFAAVYGILLRDGHTDPGSGPIYDTDPGFTPSQTFSDALALARGEYYGNIQLYDNVLGILLTLGGKATPLDDGFGDPFGEPHIEVRGDQLATVVRSLLQQGVLANDPLLNLKAEAALSAAIGANDGAPPSSIAIDLPDLEQQTDVEIIPANLQAMQAIYFAAMLEEVRIFDVTEKLLEFFQLGMLPLGKGRAGDLLYNYWRQSTTRMTQVERRNLYARCFGLPGGDASQGQPNREFSDLWLRFVSSTSSYVRQLTVDNLLRATDPVPVNAEQVRKAGRDLGANLSLHGYGVAYFAATELQKQLNDVIALLSDEEIKRAYGARNMWGVIDQVAALELGGARNSVRYRTMATAGAIVIRWLADHADLLAKSGRNTIIDTRQVRNPLAQRPPGTKVTSHPTDADLVDACEQWLAVTGTQDQRVEEMAQPVDVASAPTRPIQIPSVARDMLEAVGVKANGLFGN